MLRTTTLRADTMVVPSNASYTTDSGLLAKAIRRIAATAKRILRRRWSDPHPGAGPVPCGGQTGALDRARLRSRSAAGRDDALAVVRHTTFGAGRPGRDRRHRCRTAAGERETRAAPSTHQGHSPEGEQDGAARRRRGRLAPCHRRPLGTWSPRPGRSPRRPDSGWPGGPRTEPPCGSARTTGDARPIAKGRLGKPVEFGFRLEATLR